MEIASRIAAHENEAGVDPIEVARAVEHALLSSRPRTRYPIGRQAKLLIPLSRLLPDRLKDELVTAEEYASWAAALADDAHAVRERIFQRYPYFRTSLFERRMLFERRHRTGEFGMNGLFKCSENAVREYNSDARLRTCPECGHLNPMGYVWNTAKDTPEERAARAIW